MFRTRIRIVVLSTAFAIAAIVALAVYFIARNAVLQREKEQVQAVALVFAESIDPVQIERLMQEKNPSTSNADYQKLHLMVQEIVKNTATFQNPISRAGILIPTENSASSGFDFLVTSRDVANQSQLARVPFHSADSAFRFEMKEPASGVNSWQDAEGSWMNGYAQINNDSGVCIGLAAIEFNQANTQARLFKLFLLAFGLGMFLTILGSVVADGIVVRMLNPLELLNGAIQNISKGDFSKRLSISYPKDFVIVSQNLNQLAEDLNQKDQLRKEVENREEHDLLIQVLEDQLSKVTDVDVLLHSILDSAFKFSKCEAGSIWIVDQGQLVLWYVSNPVLEKRDRKTQGGIVNARIPISSKSIAGHCVLTKKQIVLDDVYHLPAGSPFEFNPSLDKKTGFRTRCMISIPLLGTHGAVLGVMQLINPPDQASVTNTPLVDRAVGFAVLAGQVLERASNTKDLILRLVRMAEVHDPHETGAHVQRVSGVACHLYKKLAENMRMPPDQRDQNISVLRLAAFSHDIGKVGIPDAILKKPGKLTDIEYGLMQWHTVIGAKHFDGESQFEKAAFDVAMYHHERWDGKGYPGLVDYQTIGGTLDELKDTPHLKQGLKGEQIPLFARLVAIADVFDALASQRAYKEPWNDEQIKAEIRAGYGTHFDPQLVDLFLENYEDLKAIRQRYDNTHGVVST